MKSLNEEVQRIKSIMGLNEDRYSDHFDDNNEYDRNLSKLEKDYILMASEKLHGSDNVTAQKWENYNRALDILTHMGEKNKALEAQYRITDGENPDRVYIDTLYTVKRTNDVIKIIDDIAHLININSDKDLDIHIEDVVK